MKVFSFCLYGTDSNYYTGLLENLDRIKPFFPDFDVLVYKGTCDASWTLPDWVHVVETGKAGPINMLYRYLPLTQYDIGFVRDTDSRITERDRWCIQEFLNSDKSYHIIRDHVWHKSKIMGGLFGWKRPLALALPLDSEASYGSDEAFLAEHLYPRIVADALVHTNVCAFGREHSERIQRPMDDPADFVGNVIWNGHPRFVAMLDPVEQIKVAQSYDQFALMKYLSEQVDPLDVPYAKRSSFYDSAYIANYYLGDIAKAQEWLRRFEFADIPDHVYRNSNYLLPRLGKRIVAVFDANWYPNDDEVFIYYGNYPDWHLALPGSNRIYRHVSKFWDIRHDKVRSHPNWNVIDTIYILNLEERVDRYYDTLLALCAVKAPLDRVYHYKAVKDGTPAYMGATKNHVDVMEHFCASGKERCLILEDDFVFVDNTELVWSTLPNLWNLSYDILFFALSKTGPRDPETDLLVRTTQACTTSSGYMLQKETAPKVLATAREGLELMKSTGNQHDYCIDRYWTKLPNLVCLRPKLGFQRPSYSNLLRTVSAHLD
jgi:hypothetical protein